MGFKGQTIVIHHQGESGYALTLPSVRSLASLNDYSEVQIYGNFQYRTLKGAQITKNSIGDHIYTYEEPKSNIEEKLNVIPITEISADDPFRIYDTLGSLDFMIDPRRYTINSKAFNVVWNDGKLGTLYDVTYASGTSGCLIYITRDTKNEYIISLYYDTRDTSYTKAQLVDMLVDGHIMNDDGLYTGTVELYPVVE